MTWMLLAVSEGICDEEMQTIFIILAKIFYGEDCLTDDFLRAHH